MSKHVASAVLYQMPSGNQIHPCRLIVKDGTLMWKHALLHQNEPQIPASQAHENHILKTAQRLEELNSWVSHGLEPWECFVPSAWYVPEHPELGEGISVYFMHNKHDLDYTYETLRSHIMDHEQLAIRDKQLYFQRC